MKALSGTLVTTKLFATTLAAAALVLAAPALANDLEGKIESVDTEKQSFVVQGIEFETNEHTDYDDGLNGFADLEEGQRVEVDFKYEDEKHTATEVELDN